MRVPLDMNAPPCMPTYLLVLLEPVTAGVYGRIPGVADRHFSKGNRMHAPAIQQQIIQNFKYDYESTFSKPHHHQTTPEN